MSKQIRRVQVLKRPGGRSPNWYLRYFVPKAGGGWKETWKSARTPVKREAEARRRDLERELEAGLTARDELSWAGFCVLFLTLHAARRRAETVRAYRTAFDAYERLMLPKSPADVTVRTLEEFVVKRLEQGRKPATVNNGLRHLKAALRWAERRGHVEKAPNFHGLMVREDRKKPRLLSEADFAKLVAVTNDPGLDLKHSPREWWEVLIHLGFYEGLRLGEMLSLEWADLDLTGAEGRLGPGIPSLSLRAEETKGRVDRTVPLVPGMSELLTAWRDGEWAAAFSEKLVLAWGERSTRVLYDDWADIQEAAGFAEKPYRIHDLRRGCATALIASGVSTAAVKEWLGHKAIATTESYYVNAAPALAAAANVRRVESV